MSRGPFFILVALQKMNGPKSREEKVGGEEDDDNIQRTSKGQRERKPKEKKRIEIL